MIMSDDTYIHEPEHDHLLDNDEEGLHIFDGPEYEDEHDLDSERCENHKEDDPHGPVAGYKGSYPLCEDCYDNF